MKYFVVIIYSLLLSINGYSQKKEKEYQEVVFILYDDCKIEKTKIELAKNIKNLEKNSYNYSFYLNGFDNVSLVFTEYEDFDQKEKDNPMLFLKVNKSFLRKNKDVILTRRKMIKLGYEKIYKLLSNTKHILLIDENEIVENKIIIKEVQFFFDKED